MRGGSRFASCLISILVVHAILVHIYILHLTDTIIVMSNNSGSIGNGKRGINEKLSSFLNERPPEDMRNRHDDTTITAVNSHDADKNATITLVVYSGPNTKDPNAYTAHMAKLYEKNCNYFLIHGIDCNSALTTDTVIVVGHDYYNEYLPKVQQFNDKCWAIVGRDSIILVARRNVCYDMESARLALYGGVSGVRPISDYDYFVFVNCGMTGPAPPSAKWPSPWTSHFTQLLDDTVKMSGLTLNCDSDPIHMMSIVYALDRVGLDIIMKSGAIFDCLDVNKNAPLLDPGAFNQYMIENYEVKMGRAILDAGYGLRPLIQKDKGKGMLVTKENAGDCNVEYYRDIWLGSQLMSAFHGRIPLLEDVLFFKTSRYLSPEIAAQINYTNEVNWNWD